MFFMSMNGLTPTIRKSKNNKNEGSTALKEVNGVRQETRRRRTREEILEAERSSGISAERKKNRSKEILDHIAEKSGIDDAVYAVSGNEIDDAKVHLHGQISGMQPAEIHSPESKYDDDTCGAVYPKRTYQRHL